jgi:hypothetical protein
MSRTSASSALTIAFLTMQVDFAPAIENFCRSRKIWVVERRSPVSVVVVHYPDGDKEFWLEERAAPVVGETISRGEQSWTVAAVSERDDGSFSVALARESPPPDATVALEFA